MADTERSLRNKSRWTRITFAVGITLMLASASSLVIPRLIHKHALNDIRSFEAYMTPNGQVIHLGDEASFIPQAFLEKVDVTDQCYFDWNVTDVNNIRVTSGNGQLVKFKPPALGTYKVEMHATHPATLKEAWVKSPSTLTVISSPQQRAVQLDSVLVSPGMTTLNPGDQLACKYFAYDKNGRILSPPSISIIWRINPKYANAGSITNEGVFTAKTSGYYKNLIEISVTGGGQTVSNSITVTVAR